MEDEEGTCLLDILCDPQALSDFLQGTNELDNEDLLISASLEEAVLFPDALSPVSLLEDDPQFQDSPPHTCVDLSFLEEALLASPEGAGGLEVARGLPDGAEVEEASDVLWQSLRETDLPEPREPTFLRPPALLPALLAPHLPDRLLSISQAALPDTQAAVEPPQPSLLAAGPGCPSLKPAAFQLMGFMPGTAFPTPPPEASNPLSPVRGSGMHTQMAQTDLTLTSAPTTAAAYGQTPSGPQVDGAPNVTSCPKQTSSFTGPLQLNTPPAETLHMPGWLDQDQHWTRIHGATLGNHISLLSGPQLQVPGVAPVSILNGGDLQGLSQRPLAGRAEGQPNLPQPSVVLQEREDGGPNRGTLSCWPEPEQNQLGGSYQAPTAEHQQSHPAVTPQRCWSPAKHGVTHSLPQVLDFPSSSKNSSVGISPLPVIDASPASPPASQRKAPNPTLPISESGKVSSTSVTTLSQPGTGPAGTLCSPLVGQTLLETPPVSFSSYLDGQARVFSGSSKAAVMGSSVSSVGTAPSPLPVSACELQQPVPLHVPADFWAHAKPPAKHQTSGTLPPFLAVKDFGICPASTKKQIQTALQFGSNRGENADPRRQRFQQQLSLDRGAVLNPDTRCPFLTLEHCVRGLLPYHTCARQLPRRLDFLKVDEQFEAVSGLLVKRTKDMLNKHRRLMLAAAQQVTPSAEMVMLERLFLQSERAALAEERRMAKWDPETFFSLLPKSTATSPGKGLLVSSPPTQPGSPPSPLSWAPLNHRPPGLKTYCSSSRGALKLTLKQEAGSQEAGPIPAHGTSASPHQEQGHDERLTNGKEAQTIGRERAFRPVQSERTLAPALSVPDSRITPGPLLDPAVRPPRHKRPRTDTVPGQQSPPRQLLESAIGNIGNILELQCQQGPQARLHLD